MLEIDATVIAPEELVSRVRQRLGRGEAPVAVASGDGGGADFKPLEENLRQLHAQWYIGLLAIRSHRRWIGAALVFGKKLVTKLLRWYVDERWARQSDFNGTVTRAVSDTLRLQREGQQRLASLAEGLARLRREDEARHEAAQARQAEALAPLQQALEAWREHQERQAITEAAIKEELSSLRRSLNEAREENAYLNTRLRRLTVPSAGSPSVPAPSAPLPGGPGMAAGMAASADVGIDYVLFENRFRGAREGLIEHLRPLVAHFAPCFNGQGRVVDIGCGRGEMLELLRAEGCDAVGIDLDADMVGYCQERALPVEQAEALGYLAAQADGSLGGIFLSQVIEHLETAEWGRFLDLAHLKLRAGGVLVIETINPGSFYALAHAFYKDLTHVRPVHPETLQFVAEAKGYRQTQLVPRSPHPTLGALEGQSDVVRALAETVFGHMDYAFVAHR